MQIMHHPTAEQDQQGHTKSKYFIGPGGRVIRKEKFLPQVDNNNNDRGALRVVASEKDVKALLYSQTGQRGLLRSIETPSRLPTYRYGKQNNEGPNYIDVQRSLYRREPNTKAKSVIKQEIKRISSANNEELVDLENSLLGSTKLLPLGGYSSIYSQLASASLPVGGDLIRHSGKKKKKGKKMKMKNVENADQRRKGVIDGKLNASDYFSSVRPDTSTIEMGRIIAEQRQTAAHDSSVVHSLEKVVRHQDQKLENLKKNLDANIQKLVQKSTEYDKHKFYRRIKVSPLFKGFGRGRLFAAWSKWLAVKDSSSGNNELPEKPTSGFLVEDVHDDGHSVYFSSSGNHTIAEDTAVAAATKIQSRIRQHQAQSKVALMRVEIADKLLQENLASSRIQGCFRVLLARKKCSELLRVTLISELKQLGNGKMTRVLNISDLDAAEMNKIKSIMKVATLQAAKSKQKRYRSPGEIRQMIYFVRIMRQKRELIKTAEKDKWNEALQKRRDKSQKII